MEQPEIRVAANLLFAANDFELRLDLKAFDLKAGDQVHLRFEGSDELAEPIALSIGQHGSRPTELRGMRAPKDSVRIASLNTLKQGSASPERAPLIKQIFQFADADIYCFNEELDEAKFRNSFQAVVPNEVADTGNVHWAETCAIVSRFPLTPLDFKCREAAALESFIVSDDRPTRWLHPRQHYQSQLTTTCGYARISYELSLSK